MTTEGILADTGSYRYMFNQNLSYENHFAAKEIGAAVISALRAATHRARLQTNHIPPVGTYVRASATK